MKIEFDNLGPLYRCKVGLGDLTILTGLNNTGKTYVTYGVFGLLAGWRHWLEMPSFDDTAKLLTVTGTAPLDLSDFSGEALRPHLVKLGHAYRDNLARVLAADPQHLQNVKVHLHMDECPRVEDLNINLQQTFPSGQSISFTKAPNELIGRLALTASNASASPVATGIPPEFFVSRWLSETVAELVFQRCFPRVYIASTERTGAAIFQRELNLGRNRLIEMLADLKPGEKPDPWTLMQRMASSYAFPVQQNVDFLNPSNLEPLQHQESALVTKNANILDALERIAGGTYKVTKEGGAYFSPASERGLRLRLGESSSAVRSLLDITYYIKHVLRPGDCFMIDEPELNLHPKNQRLLARLIGRLINSGVKVFLTTHSDYVVRELNTLILLASKAKSQPELLKELNYTEDELVDCSRVRFYRTCEELLSVDGGKRRRRMPVLEEIKVTNERGIEVKSFDEEIDDMNKIQDTILYSGAIDAKKSV
ncbi:MAG TPA: AAA family ATPase [Verrucomicrobiae bacterium]|jgi:hypothetical protein|nr:AAA family ATPase [Verrucomicrobiae bacterium]